MNADKLADRTFFYGIDGTLWTTMNGHAKNVVRDTQLPREAVAVGRVLRDDEIKRAVLAAINRRRDYRE